MKRLKIFDFRAPSGGRPHPFPFLDLLDELKAYIEQKCSLSTRICLSLSCKELYFTPERVGLPSRPRLTWARFLRSAFKENEISLLRFAALELGMDTKMMRAAMHEIEEERGTSSTNDVENLERESAVMNSILQNGTKYQIY